MEKAKDNKNKNKGFGSMDEKRKQELASKGGRVSAQGDTSNRGFASMDREKQREISSQGGTSAKGKVSRATNRNEDAENRYGVKGDLEGSERELNSLEEEDEIANSLERASYSETDEDEDEGVGDGNIGRSRKSPGSDEEG